MEMPAQQKIWKELTPAEQKATREALKAIPAPKGMKTEKTAATQFNLKGYVHCDLAKSDREQFALWAAGLGDAAAFDRLMKLADSGYLVKLGANREGFQATLSAFDVEPNVDGYVLTAFAGDAGRAIRLLLFKHDALMLGDWTPWIVEGGDDFLR
jgi:hypothetical protein